MYLYTFPLCARKCLAIILKIEFSIKPENRITVAGAVLALRWMVTFIVTRAPDFPFNLIIIVDLQSNE
jgi:hypothetical protein